MSANKGEKHHHAKLTEEDVKTIRAMYNLPNTYFAEKLGVSNSCISRIRSFKDWTNV